MAYNRRQAERLLNAAELELFDASLVSALSTLTAAQLKAKVTRARRLRDKQRDLLQRQRLASRSTTGAKGGRTGVANVRTADKAKALAEVLARFEKRAELLTRKADTEARREAAKRATAIRKAAKPKTKAAGRPAKPATKERKAATAARTSAPAKTVSKKTTRSRAMGSGALPEKIPSAGKASRTNVGRTRAVAKRQQAKRDAR
jgi:hypothetical protein